jgi:hypothetical protein
VRKKAHIMSNVSIIGRGNMVGVIGVIGVIGARAVKGGNCV